MVFINEKWLKLINRIRQEITLKPEFLQARHKAENSARKLLNSKAGAFDLNDMETFLYLCNTEIVPPDPHSIKLRENETYTRFQLSFLGQNRKLMIKSLDKYNYWIHLLWQTVGDPLTVLSQFWSKKEVLGAGMGMPTMILYLKNPGEYNVWLPFLNDSLNLITGQDLSSKRNIENFIMYNNCINQELRKPLKLRPQEIDYILYRIKAMR